MKKWLSCLLLCLPTWAMAHPGHGSDGLWAGISHPLTGWDHLLAMLAVGLWASTLHGKARWLIPSTFVAVMIIGFMIGTFGVHIPLVEQGIAASVLILGLATAWAKKIPTAAAMAMTAIFALFHGVAHGAELGNHGAVMFALGFVASTVALHIIGFGAGRAIGQKIWTMRLSGGLIGLAGLGLLLGL